MNKVYKITMYVEFDDHHDTSNPASANAIWAADGMVRVLNGSGLVDASEVTIEEVTEGEHGPGQWKRLTAKQNGFD